MSTNYTITVSDVINIALRKLGVNIQGGTATDVQAAEAMDALNIMAGRFFTLGMPFYKETEFRITPLVAGTATYHITDVGDSTGGLFNVYLAYLQDTTTGIEMPLRVISREEYFAMTNKSQQGTPVMVCISPDGILCTMYLTPDAVTAATKTVRLYGYRNETAYTNITDSIVFPREWGEALIYCLCVRLAPEYGVSLETTNSLNSSAASALKDAIDWNPESNSTYFGVSTYGRS